MDNGAIVEEERSCIGGRMKIERRTITNCSTEHSLVMLARILRMWYRSYFYLLSDKSVVAAHPQAPCLAVPCVLFFFCKGLPGAYRIGEDEPAFPLHGSVRVMRFHISADILPAVAIDEYEVADAAVT